MPVVVLLVVVLKVVRGGTNVLLGGVNWRGLSGVPIGAGPPPPGVPALAAAASVAVSLGFPLDIPIPAMTPVAPSEIRGTFLTADAATLPRTVVGGNLGGTFGPPRAPSLSVPQALALRLINGAGIVVPAESKGAPGTFARAPSPDPAPGAVITGARLSLPNVDETFGAATVAPLHARTALGSAASPRPP